MSKMKNLFNQFIIAALALTFGACDGDDTVSAGVDWQLVWADDFDGISGEAPNSSDWSYDMGTGFEGWGNWEQQHYTDRPENIALDGNGNLAIIAREESYLGSGYTSARIKTMDKIERTYGRFEARIQLPFGQGIWPAFWMLGADEDVVGWPQCGEIDIMEFKGQEPTILHGSLHGPGYSGLTGQNITDTYTSSNRLDTDFNVYAVEWFEDRIDYYFNDVLYQTIKSSDVPREWVFDDPFFIILNVAVGGNFVGSPNPDTRFPQTMLVDYVRVYEATN